MRAFFMSTFTPRKGKSVMGDKDNILAGVSAGGTDGCALAWFGPAGTTLPTSATAVLDVDLLDAGLVTEDGLTFKPDMSSKDIKAYGSGQVQRTLITDEKNTFEITFLETNAVTVALYSKKTLASVTVGATGTINTTYGSSSIVRYTAVFDVVDGSNHTRYCCPDVEVSGRKEVKAASGEVISRGVTLTAYPDSTGEAVYEYNIVAALAAS
jgi:hypothetical protein